MEVGAIITKRAGGSDRDLTGVRRRAQAWVPARYRSLGVADGRR